MSQPAKLERSKCHGRQAKNVSDKIQLSMTFVKYQMFALTFSTPNGCCITLSFSALHVVQYPLIFVVVIVVDEQSTLISLWRFTHLASCF
jgi:hypothetical protein